MMRSLFARYLTCIAAGVIITGFGARVWGQPTFTVIKQAEPDECFNGIGEPYIPLGSGEECDDTDHIPKANQDYVWGLASDGKNIWLGTGANAAALATSLVTLITFTETEPDYYESPGGVPIRVWEYGESQYPGVSGFLASFYGDARPPRIYQYNAETGECFDRTPVDDPNLANCIGLRAAGVHNGVALLCGQNFSSTGVYMFAFDAETGEYLGSSLQWLYSQIRSFVVAEGELYAGVLNTFGLRSRGAVVKWTGNRFNPFRFVTVGNIDNDVAYITYHDGRLFAGTWRSFAPLSILFQSSLFPPPCGVWMSPPLSSRGLTIFDVNRWDKVWDPTFYEIEPGAVGGYSIGAMASYGDALYFGTLHFPGLASLAFLETYGIQLDPEDAFEEVERTPIIVRAEGYGDPGTPTVELLYGDEELPKYDPDTQTFSDEMNATGAAGLYGDAGFGNFANRYIWSAVVHDGVLYFGTFDLTSLFLVDGIVDGGPNFFGVGADLWAFLSDGTPAVPQSLTGCGNPAAHGVRNMVSLPSYGLFLGMANSANLLTDTTDTIPDGGFALQKVNPPADIVAAVTESQNVPMNELKQFYVENISWLWRLAAD